MAELKKRPPGWHPDPADPTHVRHWDGYSWQRVRNRPAWSVATGDLVVDTRGVADPTRPGGPPVVEGPVRPAPERATTSALNASGEPRGATRPAPLRAAGSTGPRAGHFPAAGAGMGTPASPPWAGSRRPLAVLGLVVIGAVIALAAVAGWTGPRRVVAGPLPSSFVSQASKDCARALGARPPAIPTDPTAIRAQDQQLIGLGNDLRSLAIADHGNLQANSWLDTWGDFTRVEQARAAALSGGTTDASTLTLTANDDAAKADQFAASNGLSACTILAASPAAMQAIPS